MARPHLFGLSVLDFLATVLGAFIIQKKWYPKENVVVIFGLLWVLGTILHVIFHVNSPIAKKFFVN